MNSKSIKIIVIVLVVIIIIFAVWEFAIKGQSTDKKAETLIPTSTPMPSEASPSAAATGNYKDGKYEAKGHYQNPARLEEVDVTLTIKDGKVADVNFVGETDAAPTTKFMQSNFKEGYKELVVGKSIDDIKLDVVNGSSLTPKGFMDALSQIKEQAKA